MINSNTSIRNSLEFGENYSIQFSDELDNSGNNKFDICLCGNIMYTINKNELLKLADMGDSVLRCHDVRISTEINNVPISVNMYNEMRESSSSGDAKIRHYISFTTPIQTFNIRLSTWDGFSDVVKRFINL